MCSYTWSCVDSGSHITPQADSEASARTVMQHRATAASRKPTHQPPREGREDVRVLVKGDVVGSVEVLVSILEKRQPEGVAVSVIHSGVGPVVDSDIEIAASTDSECCACVCVYV